MRDYAVLRPRFWIAGTGKEMRGDHEARELALFLLSAPNSNLIGLYYLPLTTIAHELGYTIEGAAAVLARVTQTGFAHYDMESEYVWVVTMAAETLGDDPKAADNRIRGIRNELAKHRKSPFHRAFVEYYTRLLAVDSGAPPVENFAPRVPSEPLTSPFEGVRTAQPTPPESGSGTGAGTGDGTGERTSGAVAAHVRTPIALASAPSPAPSPAEPPPQDIIAAAPERPVAAVLAEARPGEPATGQDRLDELVKLVRRRFSEEYERATQLPWNAFGAPGVFGIASWLYRAGGAPEARLDTLLETFFADPWVAERIYPIEHLSKNCGRYMAPVKLRSSRPAGFRPPAAAASHTKTDINAFLGRAFSQ